MEVASAVKLALPSPPAAMTSAASSLPSAFSMSALVTATSKSLGMFCMLGSCSEIRPVDVSVWHRV